MNIRYVVTFVNKDGIRIIAHPATGLFTHDTPQSAQRWLNACLKNNSTGMLKYVYGETPQFEVRPCECWPDNEPKDIYFD